MATYTGEYTIDGRTVGQPFNGYWKFKCVLNINKVGNSGRYDWSADTYVRLGSYSSAVFKAQNVRPSTDPKSACFEMYFTGISETSVYGSYGPISSNDADYSHFLSQSGTLNVTGTVQTKAGFWVTAGWGSSIGTGTGSFDAADYDFADLTLSGVTPAVPSNVRSTGTTSSSISMTFDVDWGNEPENGTRDVASVLRNNAGTEIGVIRNGTSSATFTGLTRYTPYYIVGYACNSAGGGYTHNTGGVLVYTKPENPTISKPTISNIGRLTTTVTPGVVTDNGGKTITEVETYIKGGAYGNTLTSVGKGSSAKNLTGLQPNTTYQVITRATNGITEAYSAYASFTTIGNPPTITDLYATNLSLTGANILYTATYDHNASFKNYLVQWRYPGTSTWTSLTTSNNKITGTNFDSLNQNNIEYRIIVTDNWNRSTTSRILTYTVLYDYTNDITNFKYVANANGTYTISGNWTKRLRNKLLPCMITGTDGSQIVDDIITSNSTLDSITDTSFSTTTRAFKNKRTPKSFMLYLRPSSSNKLIVKYLTIKAESYPNAINTINSSGNKVSRQFSTITKEDGNVVTKKLRQHDIIKLSKTMRYIDIDSRGTSDSKNTFTNTITITTGRIVTSIKYTVTHISKTLYMISFDEIKVKTNDNSNIRIRNNSFSLLLNNGKGDNYNFRTRLYMPNMTITKNYTTIDSSSFTSYFIQKDQVNTPVNINIAMNLKPEFDCSEDWITQSNDYTKTIVGGNADVATNHIVNIKVIDKDGVDRAYGKTLKLTDGSAVLTYNGGNPTNGTTDSNKFVYSDNGLPIRLDLGAEYQIKQIIIQRRILSNNEYFRNYIIGRNKDLELCYIFYDSNASNTYKETSKTINTH